ncbi:MAG: M56 family metallopeptidase [Gemmataceae bacterium]
MVDTFVHMGLSNAVMATVLAVAAASVGAMYRKPAVVHCLWLLVLLKLLTPPLVAVPLPWPRQSATTAAVTMDQDDIHKSPAERPAIAMPLPPEPLPDIELPLILFLEEPDAPLAEGAGVDRPIEDKSIADKEIHQTRETPTTPLSAPAAIAWPWSRGVLAVWLGGSAAWFALAAWRIRRFQRGLRCAEPAPAWLADEVAELARALGLRRRPSVWLVSARLSPLVWALGGPARLLLPTPLLQQLDDDQRAALLVHELAHLRRRDHWLRGLELVTLGLYWWHPVVWWARRELRAAEEQCCDGWVVWAFPQRRRAYATALVQTLTFLSEARTTVPMGASGIGPIPDLKRRLTMIMRGTTPRALGWGGFLACLALAAFLLPLTPSWADDKDKPKPAAEKQESSDQDAPKEEPKTDADKARRAEEIEKTRAEIKELEQQLRRLQQEVQTTHQRLHEAHMRLARLHGGPPRGGLVKITIQGPDGPVRTIEVPGPGAGDVIRDLEKHIRIPVPPAVGAPFRRPVEPMPPDRRFQDLERKLDALMRELEHLRKEVRPPRPGSAPEGHRPPPAPPRPERDD